MKNISLPIFTLSGGPQLSLEESNNEDRIRLIIHDSADRQQRGLDIILSCPIEMQKNLADAVAAFNAKLKLATVIY